MIDFDNWEFEWESKLDINLKKEFDNKLQYRREKYAKKTNMEILLTAIKCGKELNEVTDHFHAYDVALKILYNDWIPTEKQRKAIINVTAFFKTKRKFNKDYQGELYE